MNMGLLTANPLRAMGIALISLLSSVSRGYLAQRLCAEVYKARWRFIHHKRGLVDPSKIIIIGEQYDQ